MKKLLVFLLIGAFLVGSVNAGEFRRKIIDNITLDDDPVGVSSSTVNAAQFESVGFFFEYDESQPSGNVSVEVTVDFSYDGTTWIDGGFYDIANSTVLQTSETISADGTDYFFWLEKAMNPSRVRVKAIAGTGVTDANNTATIDCWVVGKQ